jgi:hypothetical protein
LIYLPRSFPVPNGRIATGGGLVLPFIKLS